MVHAMRSGSAELLYLLKKVYLTAEFLSLNKGNYYFMKIAVSEYFSQTVVSTDLDKLDRSPIQD